MCRDLKSKATVALSGEGADELFAGYGPPLLAVNTQRRRAELDGEKRGGSVI